MQFDLTSFLSAMFKAFLECREDGDTTTVVDRMQQRTIVRFAARRTLRSQARKQGANRRERREFQEKHMDEAMAGLQGAVQEYFPS